MRAYRLIPMAAAFVLAAGILSAPAQESALASGEVTNIDELEAGKITIKHGPIPNLGLNEDGKSTDFRPKDKALFAAVKAGDRIRFTAERVNGELVISRVEK